VASESGVTWATSVPSLVFLGISLLDLGPIYATDIRQTKATLNAPAIRGMGITSRGSIFRQFSTPSAYHTAEAGFLQAARPSFRPASYTELLF